MTANFQLRPRSNPPGVSFSDPDEPAPRFDQPGSSTARSWRSFDREPRRAVLLVRGVFGPGRACRSASDVPRRDRPVRARPFGPTRAGCRQDSLPPSPRQRQRLRRTRDAFPRRVPSPPLTTFRPRLALRPNDGSPHHREPATVPAAWPPGPASSVLFVVEGSRASPALASGLDPRAPSPLPVAGGISDQTLPVDFCNQYSPRAQPRTFRSPDRTCRSGLPSSR